MDQPTRRQRLLGRARQVSARARTSVGAVHERLGLSRRGWLALVVALTTLGTALLVLAGLADAVREGDGLTTDDPRGLAWFVSARSGGVVGAARLLTEIGGVVVLVALATVSGLWLWRRRQPLVVALVPLVALSISGPAVAVAKSFFGRSRPDAALRLVTENQPSFPSGHSANSTAVLLAIGLTVAVFVLRRPLARIGAVAVAVAVSIGIGLSRLVLGVHWPTDVVAGWVLGGSIAILLVVAAALLVRLAADRTRPPGRRAGRMIGVVATRRPRPA